MIDVLPTPFLSVFRISKALMLHPNAWSQADFKVSRVGQSKQYYLRVNDKALYVSELVAVIVEGLHARHTVAEITATVNQRAL